MSTIPTKWKVRITEENREVLEQWRIKQPGVMADPKITCLVDNSLNRWLVSEIYDGSYLHWGDALEYKEITYEQFKQFILMENKFTPIAMKCNQEQFDVIRPILEEHGMKMRYISSFDKYLYLTNNYHGEQGLISNVGNYAKNSYNRTVYEEWNQDLFLRCCGIDPNPKFKVGDKVIIKKGSVGYGTGGWRGEFQNIIQTQGYLTISKEYTNGDGTQQIIHFEESAYQATSRWLTLYTETKTEMKTYLTKISDLKKIHDVACAEWKSKIKALITDPFADYIVLSQTQVDEMFKAAQDHQRPVLVEVFGEPAPKHNFKKGEIIWVWDNHHQYPSVREFIQMDYSNGEFTF